MNRLVEIVLTLTWMAGMLVVWVVMIAAVLLPFTWLANWWLGDEVALLGHPRRNAIVLATGLFTVVAMLEFSPARTGRPSEQGRWWQRRCR
jgi:hypothetical protein